MNALFSVRNLVVYCASVALRPVSLGLAIALVIAGMVVPGRAQIVDGRQLVKAQLVADTQHIEPGQKFRLGVLYTIAPKWHIYWKYPGDAGIPTQIDWQLPPGFRARSVDRHHEDYREDRPGCPDAPSAEGGSRQAAQDRHRLTQAQNLVR